MKRWVVVLLLLLPTPAWAGMATPGMGSGWIHTPRAWNHNEGWYLSALGGIRQNDLSSFAQAALLYSTYNLEFFGGIHHAGTPENIDRYGIGARYQVWKGQEYAGAVFAFAQRTKDPTESRSNMAAGFVGGLHRDIFTLNAFAALHSDAGPDAEGIYVGDDWQVGLNLEILLQPGLKLVGEWYDFFDSDRSAFAGAFYGTIQEGVHWLLGFQRILDPFTQTQVLFGMHARF